MKQYTNSKGESLPKVICAVVDFEIQKQNIQNTSIGPLFKWHESEIFGKDKNANKDSWARIFNADYDCFYSIFPTCKNSRGQELPEEIQVEIVEERLRQLGQCEDSIWKFSFLHSAKGHEYWLSINNDTDYTPTKSDDTFTQGEIVEVRDGDYDKWQIREYVCTYKGHYIACDEKTSLTKCMSWKQIRKPEPQPLELTLPELLTIAESVKGAKVKLKS